MRNTLGTLIKGQMQDCARKRKIHFFSSSGQWPASYCQGIVSVVHASMCASLNFSFEKILLRNLLDFTIFYRKFSLVVLFQIP